MKLLPQWVRETLTDEDNTTFNTEAVATAIAMAAYLALSAWGVVVNKEAFLPNAIGFGTGIASLIAAFGAARRLAAKTPAEPSA